MEHKYADILIDACSTVLDSFSSRRIASADVTPSNITDSREIFVSMGLNGDIDGQVMMSMDAQTGKSLASEMLGGMEITDVDELVTSAVGELCNMIMGNACCTISTQHTSVELTPPTVTADAEAPRMDESAYQILLRLDDADSFDLHVTV